MSTFSARNCWLFTRVAPFLSQKSFKFITARRIYRKSPKVLVYRVQHCNNLELLLGFCLSWKRLFFSNLRMVCDYLVMVISRLYDHGENSQNSGCCYNKSIFQPINHISSWFFNMHGSNFHILIVILLQKTAQLIFWKDELRISMAQLQYSIFWFGSIYRLINRKVTGFWVGRQCARLACCAGCIYTCCTHNSAIKVPESNKSR